MYYLITSRNSHITKTCYYCICTVYGWRRLTISFQKFKAHCKGIFIVSHNEFMSIFLPFILSNNGSSIRMKGNRYDTLIYCIIWENIAVQDSDLFSWTTTDRNWDIFVYILVRGRHVIMCVLCRLCSMRKL